MIKPHITLAKSSVVRGRIWLCKGNTVIGSGYSPRQAYLDWLFHCKSRRLAPKGVM